MSTSMQFLRGEKAPRGMLPPLDKKSHGQRKRERERAITRSKKRFTVGLPFSSDGRNTVPTLGINIINTFVVGFRSSLSSNGKMSRNLVTNDKSSVGIITNYQGSGRLGVTCTGISNFKHRK